MKKLRGVATRTFVALGYTCVQYHDTIVARFNDNKIILDTDGWYTVTTKKRMNQASRLYGLGYHVYQRNHEWYVDYNGKTISLDKDILIIKR